MGDKYVSKFVIASICTMVSILMLIMADRAYMFNALAQTNETAVGTNRIINIQRTTSSEENMTDNDDAGNDLIIPNRIINNVGAVATDKFTNIFIADSSNHAILKFDGAGKFITKWGSTGSGDGQFNGTLDIATDVFNNIFVADSGNNRIQKFDGAGKLITKWGSTGSGDGQFAGQLAISTDIFGGVFVVDFGAHKGQKFDGAGRFIEKFAFQ